MKWSEKLAHYRSMFDNAYVGAWDLDGKDVTVTIEKVTAGTLTSQRGTDKKPILHFKGTEKGFVANKTNCKTIATMYGTNVEEWVGKKITLYATTTSAGGETVECIRVRPQAPK